METNLKYWRKLRKAKAEDLALKAEMTVGNYYKYERGEQTPDSKVLAIWSEALGIDPKQLIENTPPAGFSDEGAIYEAEPGYYLDKEYEPGLDLWEVSETRLDMAGIHNGTIVLIDSRAGFEESLRTGLFVIAQQYYDDPDAPLGQAAITIFRQFIEPGLLITNSRTKNEPSLVLNKDPITIMGVVRSIHPAKYF